MRERGNGVLRFLDRMGGIALVNIVGAFRRKHGHMAFHKRDPRIGILCLGAIGDLLLSSALIDALKNKFPGSEIDIIGSSANAQALPLLPHARRKIAFKATRPWKIARWLAQQKYDFLIDTGQWARVSALVAAFSGSSFTVGFDTEGQHRSAAYDIVACHRSDAHEVENFLDLGRVLWPELKGRPHLVAPERMEAEEQGHIYCHMWPAQGKGRRLKQWPARHWAKLISALLAEGHSVMLTGSGEDWEDSEAFIREHFPREEGIGNLSGKIDLTALACALKRAKALVSVNTGVMHLGAILNTPTVGLHGPTNPARWGPVGERAISLLPDRGRNAYLDLGFEYPPDAENNLEHLQPEAVLQALRRLKAI